MYTIEFFPTLNLNPFVKRAFSCKVCGKHELICVHDDDLLLHFMML